MDIAEAKQQVKHTVQAYLAKDDAGLFRIAPAEQRPIFLLGAPGIGKTAIMAQVADELGIGLVSYSMTHHTRQSALGLPFIVHRAYRTGDEFDVSEYTMSEIIASVYDYMERTGRDTGILFLDEINCVSETLYPSMLQFLQFKTFGRHSVPQGWIVVCAGNPPEYNKSVHEFDIVTLDRLRKIEVQPSFDAWRSYARERAVHPAIMTYLSVRPDDFYLVESTPEGKSFVSARSWSELSTLMALYEQLDLPVDANVIAQYLQHSEISERFASYYDLFKKYRSDYQVEAIMTGEVPAEIMQRAQSAGFDERLALLALLLDGLGSRMRAVRERQNALEAVRDALRDAKPRLQGGAGVQESIGPHVKALEDKAALQATDITTTQEAQRTTASALAQLKALMAAATLEHVKDGVEALDAIEPSYRELVGQLERDAAAVSTDLDNSFAFIADAFGEEREMLVFVTELTARHDTSQFIARFGSDSYHEHSTALSTETNRDAINEEIEALIGAD